jgi:hypothetical protein
MIDGRSGLRLTLEPFNCESVAGYLFRKELQRNFALKLRSALAMLIVHSG